MNHPAAYRTPHELAVQGFDALVRELGPGAAVQFINLYERGAGDYTAERRKILRGVTLEDMQKALLPDRAGK